MRAAVVSDISNMQWAIDVITLSNSRRWGNHKLFEEKRDSCIEKVKQLPMTLSKINQHKEMIINCCRPRFWEDASESDLDEVIEHLGPLMKHRDPVKSVFRELDLQDFVRIRTWLEIGGKPMQKTTYQDLVKDFILNLVEKSPALQSVKNGERITQNQISEILELFKSCEHDINIENMRDAWGVKKVNLEEFLAHILRGADLPDWETKVRDSFELFIQNNSTFNARQIEMLFALCNYIIDNESISKPALVSAPFTNYDRRGFPGVFKMDQINEILSFTEALTA